MSPLDLIPGVSTARNALIALGLVSALTGGAWLHGHHRGTLTERAAQEQKTLALRSEQEAQARMASEAFRRTEADLRAQRDTAQQRYDDAQKLHASSIAAARRDADSLRQQIASYAAGSGSASDTQAAASDRAATLGILLDEALRTSGECAREAESQADAVRALLEAWPGK